VYHIDTKVSPKLLYLEKTVKLSRRRFF